MTKLIIKCGICFLSCLFTAIIVSMRCGHYGCATCVAYLLRMCDTCWECSSPLNAMLMRRLDSLELDVEVVGDFLACGLDSTAWREIQMHAHASEDRHRENRGHEL